MFSSAFNWFLKPRKKLNWLKTKLTLPFPGDFLHSSANCPPPPGNLEKEAMVNWVR